MTTQSDSDLEFEDTDEYDEYFTLATQHIQRVHDKLLPNDLLELYGFYKQGTAGKCNTPKPTMFNMQARAKWSAWNDLGDMTNGKAKQLYVEKVQKLEPAWWESIRRGEKQKQGNGWVVHSVELPPDNEKDKPEGEKTIFDFVRERNLVRVKEMLKPSDLHLLDNNGMALIHWAADANDVEMLRFLLNSGCSTDVRDAEQQQTPLHYAASCAHADCVQLLLERGANKMAQDADGQTCFDVADDPAIRSLLQP